VGVKTVKVEALAATEKARTANTVRNIIPPLTRLARSQSTMPGAQVFPLDSL
jgi:hypothetical protein